VVPFPVSASEIFSVFSIFNFDFIWELVDKFNKTVSGSVNYANMTLFMMAAFASFLGGMFLGIELVCRTRLRHDTERREAYYDKTVLVVVAVIFCLHPVLTVRLVKLWHTTSYGVQELLTADPSLGYDDPQAYVSLWTYQLASIPFCLAYILGIPAVFYHRLYITARPKEHPNLPLQELKKWEKLQRRREIRYLLLYGIYKPEAWWFELSEVARKIGMISLVVFIPPPGSTTQIGGAALIGLIFLIMFSLYLPHIDPRLNLFSFLSQVCTVLSLLMMLFLRTDISLEGVVSVELLQRVLTIVQCAPPLLALAMAYRTARSNFTKADVAKKQRAKLPAILLDEPPKPESASQRATRVLRRPMTNASFRHGFRSQSHGAILATKAAPLSKDGAIGKVAAALKLRVHTLSSTGGPIEGAHNV